MKRKIIIIVVTLVVVLAIIGTSFAYLKTSEQSTNNQTLTLSSFDVVLLTDITNVNLSTLYPVSDSEGLQNQSTTFQIKNNGSLTASYKVSLIDGATPSTMNNHDVRYQLKRTVGSNPEETLDITNLNGLGLIDTGTIEPNQVISYTLTCWIDIDANPNGQSFSKKILVEGMQVESLDKSGANYPELLDNMIPVYYEATNDTEGVWKKADSTNKNSSYKWFDYDNLMWANAVTVKANGTQTRDSYLSAANGTTIAMEDITAMWVWIPRYKYEIFNGNNETADEQMINVYFEHGIDNTGTVSCVDNNLTNCDLSSSEICTDTTNDGVKNKKSTYTHPAFTFGDEQLTGFWIGKFEASTDNATCLNNPSSTNCNNYNINILVKPDVDSLRYIRVAYLFSNMRRMEATGNIHGFKQNLGAYVNSIILSGVIANDDNNVDTHMIKNMEWGAVAYLSQSKYGKYGNSLYTGDYKEVYINNYHNYNSGYKTGYSALSYNSPTYLYNDLTDQGSGKGYRGAGASTTGNIYGVYDMSGGLYEYVMGNVIDSYGNLHPSYGFEYTWTSLNNEYYDKYTYCSSSGSLSSSIGRGKLGDATKEIVKEFNTSNGGWNSRMLYFPDFGDPWFVRGRSGIFSIWKEDGETYQEYGSRPILAVSREFPWLN